MRTRKRFQTPTGAGAHLTFESGAYVCGSIEKTPPPGRFFLFRQAAYNVTTKCGGVTSTFSAWFYVL